jgi:hypothetical protein
MKTSYLKRCFLAFLILFLPVVTLAGNHYTSDPDSGLDWLNLGETAGMEYNAALTSFPGWRHATNSEVEALFNKSFVGFPPGCTNDVAETVYCPYTDLRDHAKGFIASYGPSFTDYELGGSGVVLQRYAQGVYRDESSTLRVMGAIHSDYYGVSQVIGIEWPGGVISVNPRYGIFLVRGSTAPSDVTPPDLLSVVLDFELIAPADGEWEVQIDVSATDAESGVAYVELYLDDPGSDVDGEGVRLSKSVSPAQSSVNVTFTTVFPQDASEGIWLLSGKVQDAANNWTPILGGHGDIPAGVLVDNSECDARYVRNRVGPYKDNVFGGAINHTFDYLLLLDAEKVRHIQGDMFLNNGWDKELQNIDYDVYKNYCEMQSVKKRAREGEQYHLSKYEGHRGNIARLVIDDLDNRVYHLELLLNQVEAELKRGVYRDLMASIVQADRRDLARRRQEELIEADLYFSTFNTLYSIGDWVYSTAKGVAARVSGVGVVLFIKDIRDIAVNGHTILQILSENEDFETYGEPFTELWLMYLELTVLIDQYSEQRDEYEKLYERSAL